MNFDMRAFLREIALANAYQRSFDPPGRSGRRSPTKRRRKRRGCKKRESRWPRRPRHRAKRTRKRPTLGKKSKPKRCQLPANLDTAKTKYADAKKKADEAAKAAADAASQLQAKKTVVAPVQQAATAAQEAVKALPQR